MLNPENKKKEIRNLMKALFPLYCLLVLTIPALAAADSTPMPERGICAHRGANSTHPENTLPAFEEAIRLGAHMIELDVRQTKDGHLVLMHDATIDETTNGKG